MQTTKMSSPLGLFLVLLVAVSVCEAADKFKWKELFCLDDKDIAVKIGECLGMLPEKVNADRKECMTKIAPQFKTDEEFHKEACEDLHGMGETMAKCIIDKRSALHELPKDFVKKFVDAVDCLSKHLNG